VLNSFFPQRGKNAFFIEGSILLGQEAGLKTS